MEGLIIGLAGTLLGALAKHIAGERKWRAIRNTARKILADPAETNDAQTALTQALIQANLDRVYTEAEKVRDSLRTVDGG